MKIRRTSSATIISNPYIARRHPHAFEDVVRPEFAPFWAEPGETHGHSVDHDDSPIYSAVLGPDGYPLEYERDPVGFDLRPAWLRDA